MEKLSNSIIVQSFFFIKNSLIFLLLIPQEVNDLSNQTGFNRTQSKKFCIMSNNTEIHVCRFPQVLGSLLTIFLMKSYKNTLSIGRPY